MSIWQSTLFIVLGTLFWFSIHNIFGQYATAFTSPPPTITSDLPFWFWIGFAIVCVALRETVGLTGISLSDFLRKRKLAQRVWMTIAVLCYVAGLVGLLALLYPLWASWVGLQHPAWSLAEAYGWVTLCGFAELGGRILKAPMVASLLLDADRAIKNDPRPPIVYLRAFDRDLQRPTPAKRLRGDIPRMLKGWRGYKEAALRVPGTGKPSLQEMALIIASNRGLLDPQLAFASVMSRVGPYIAIGRPGEGSDGGVDIGAAKKFVADSEWQDVVKEWIEMAAVVVFEVGATKGLLWELSYAIANIDKTRILIILPWEQIEYERFLHVSAAAFPHDLPKERPKSRMLAFDRHGVPIELPPSERLSASLEPFLERLGLVLPDTVKIPEELMPLAQKGIVEGRFFGASEYVSKLITDDHERKELKVRLLPT